MTPLLVMTGWLAALGLIARLRARDELMARACHELRSPLTAARLAVETGCAPGVVELELRRVGRAVDDLGAARRGRRAAELVEPVEAGELLGSVRAAWEPVADGLGRDLEVTPPPGPCFVRADRLRLAQAIGNLVGNALEHGEGAVRVRGRAVDGMLRIDVEDGGDGLPAPVDALAALARGGRGRRGRGLAIASEVARRCGGRLAAAPTSCGARLVLELPALGPDAPGGRAGGAPLANRLPRLWRLAR
jgi:signal transduction histidine kinase